MSEFSAILSRLSSRSLDLRRTLAASPCAFLAPAPTSPAAPSRASISFSSADFSFGFAGAGASSDMVASSLRKRQVARRWPWSGSSGSSAGLFCAGQSAPRDGCHAWAVGLDLARLAGVRTACTPCGETCRARERRAGRRASNLRVPRPDG